MTPHLLLYPEDSRSEHHEAARVWWDKQLSGSDSVALCRPVLTAFIRIGTNPRLPQRPLTWKDAIERVQSWLDQPCVRLILTSDQHWSFFQQMLRARNASGNLVSDAHLAALAMEHNSTRYSTDPDFAGSNGRTQSFRDSNPFHQAPSHLANHTKQRRQPVS